MAVFLADFRKALRALLDAALGSLCSPELELPVEGRALRRLDRAERITAAGG